jgi:N-acetylglucosaminyl-diphospho-decaprenol L-rhamnosyltransferase
VEPPVAVVLVHWDQPERCAEAVAAWRAQTVPVALTVVDNASAPGARARLAALVGDDAEVVDAGANLGFGPGANVGLRRFLADAGAGEWVAVAPHDALPAPDCIEAMTTVLADRPATGLACADVGDGHVPIVDPYFGGMMVPVARDTVPWAVAPAAAAAPPVDAPPVREVEPRWEPVGYPHGTLLLARRACLAEVGVFDERYFSYCEEADLGERARRAGWDVALIRGAEVRNPHMGSGAAVSDYLMLRNTLLFVREHFGRYHAAVRAALAVADLARGLARPSTRPWIFVPRARLRALADAARGRYGPPPPPVRRVG